MIRNLRWKRAEGGVIMENLRGRWEMTGMGTTELDMEDDQTTVFLSILWSECRVTKSVYQFSCTWSCLQIRKYFSKKKKHLWDWVAGMCISVTSGRSKWQPEPRHNLPTFRKNTQRKVWHNGFRLPQEGAGKRKEWSYTKAQPLRRQQVAYWVDPDLDFGELWCRTPSEPDKGSPIMNKIVRFLRARTHKARTLSCYIRVSGIPGWCL